MAILGDFFASCIFSKPRAAGLKHAARGLLKIQDAKIHTNATLCVEVWQTSNL